MTHDPAPQPTAAPPADLAALLREIVRDLQVIAHDEIELVRTELARHLEQTIARAIAAWLGATVALIGLGMLCAVAVAALAPAIPALWLRLLVMALVYLVIGGAVAGVFGARLARGLAPDLGRPLAALKRTARTIGESLSG